MLEIPRSVLDAIFVQSKAEMPFEACGLLAGLGQRVAEAIAMTNVDQSGQHFMMDPKEQFAAIKAIRRAGLQLLAIYHSHPTSPAWPSEEDIRLALTPGVAYVIISFAEGPQPTIRAFRIQDGQVIEEGLEVEDE